MTTTLERPTRDAEIVEAPQVDEVSQRLLEAADLLEAEGFIQGAWTRSAASAAINLELGYEADATCGRCTVGAIFKMDTSVVAYKHWVSDLIGREAIRRVMKYLGLRNKYPGVSDYLILSDWSEKVGRTREDVTAALRGAAALGR